MADLAGEGLVRLTGPLMERVNVSTRGDLTGAGEVWNLLDTSEIKMIRTRWQRFIVHCAVANAAAVAGAASIHEADVVIYGGTSAGVMAAVQARRMGCRVVLVCPERHLGGMTSSGLGWTDTGNKAVIGGLAREFYHRVWLHYQRPEAW